MPKPTQRKKITTRAKAVGKQQMTSEPKPNPSPVQLIEEGEGRRMHGTIMGVDVHRDVLAYCMITDQELVKEGQLPNTRTIIEDEQEQKGGIDQLIGLCKRNQIQGVAMESTAQYHFKLMYALMEKGIPLLVANPQQTKSTQGKKTDKLDARRVAVAYRDGRLKPSVITPQEIMSLRKGLRTLIKYVQETTKIKQRAKQLFHQKDADLGDLLSTGWGMEVLARLCSEEIPAVMDDCVPKQSISKKNEWLKRLIRFKDSLNELEQVIFENDMALLQFLTVLKERQQAVYRIVAKKNPEFQKNLYLIMSIPGIGEETAAAILAELVDINYFKTSSKLSKWAGLAAKVNQSGHKRHITGKLYKRGNKYIRRAVGVAAGNIYSKEDDANPLYVFMKNLYDRTGKFYTAICAGARKLLEIIWHLLKQHETWNPAVNNADMLAHLTDMIKHKQKTFESRSRRLKKLLTKLHAEGQDLLRQLLEKKQRMPRLMLKALLQTV
jgi:transposase